MSKKQYETPKVEQMECRIEKGFVGSGVDPYNETLQDGESYGESDFLFS